MAEREQVGKNAQPSAAIMDAASASKPLRSPLGICGFDAHKCVKGRKRHILVDTLGLLLAVYVTPADLHDQRGARCLLAGLAPVLPHLKKLWADAAYRGQELATWCQAEGGWERARGRATARLAWLQPLAQALGRGTYTLVGFPVIGDSAKIMSARCRRVKP